MIDNYSVQDRVDLLARSPDARASISVVSCLTPDGLA
jgi:hypothetical protein